MTRALHDAQLSYQFASDELQRACGRGGAPADLPRARRALVDTADALDRLREVLEREAAP